MVFKLKSLLIAPILSLFLGSLYAGNTPSTPSSSLGSRFIEAARTNNTQTIQQLLGLGAEPNTRNPNGATALMFASFHGSLPIVQFLLSKRANINLCTTSNIDFNVGRLLVSRHGITALMLGCFAGRLDIVYTLVKAGADINAKDSDGQTPLMYTILGQSDWPASPLSEVRKKIITLLLERGADTSLLDKKGGNDAAYYYSCVAGLVPGFNGKYEKDQAAVDADPILRKLQ